MEWQPIETAPFDTDILLFWEDDEHIESGRIYKGEGHCLDDGEQLWKEPKYWMEKPMPKDNP